jgi:hypothetical protein
MRRFARFAILPMLAFAALPAMALTAEHASAAGSTVAGLNVFVGYAEDKETNTPNPAAFPIPWSGSANTIFLGNPVPGGQTACGSIPVCYDTGAIRFDNPSAQDVLIQDVFVDDHASVTGGKTFDLWGAFTVPAGKRVILAANPNTNNPTNDNFDTSSYPKTCTPLTVAPTVRITVNGVATTLVDSTHVLDTGGIDVGSCTPPQNESIQWRAVGSAGVNSAALSLAPSSTSAALGQSVTETATLVDGGGAPIDNVPVNLTVACGPNIGLSLSGTTNPSGQVAFGYSSNVPGTDTVVAQVTTVGTFVSNQAAITWGSGSNSSWNCVDLGNPAQSGSQSLSGGTWTVTGGGSDITGTSDQFHFLYRSMAGDGSASAHGVSQTAPSTNAKAGVMLRQTLDAGSPYYALLASPGTGIKVQVRTVQGGTTTKLANPTGAMPVYLKVTRAGDTYTASTSADGASWTAIAGSSITFTMPTTLLAGLVVNAHAATGLSTVIFDTVQIGSGPPPPAPVISNVQVTGISASSATISWTTSTPASSQVLYGTTASYGSSTPNDPTLVTSHSRALTALTASTAYHFTEISTDASNQTASHADATFTTSAAPPPPPPVISNVQAATTSTGATISWTTSTAASSQVVYGTTAAYGSVSANDPTLVTSHTVAIAGLAPGTTYHYQPVSVDGFGQSAASSDATFATVTASASCPSPWSCADIGSPALAGSESVSGGTWTIKAGGADIYGTADQLHFDWQTLPGDGSVSAHVVSQTTTSSWAKAGVMLRATTDAGSLNYAVFITPGNGITVQYRNAVNGTTAKLTTMVATAPIYLKASRSGTTFSAYSSPDGSTWTLIAGSTKALGSITGPLLAGMAVTSHNAGAICTVVMDTVVVG